MLCDTMFSHGSHHLPLIWRLSCLHHECRSWMN